MTPQRPIAPDYFMITGFGLMSAAGIIWFLTTYVWVGLMAAGFAIFMFGLFMDEVPTHG